MDNLQKVKECIAKNLNIPIENVSDCAKLKEDLFADSLDILTIRLSIEDVFGIVFQNNELKCMLSVDTIYNTVQEKMGCQSERL